LASNGLLGSNFGVLLYALITAETKVAECELIVAVVAKSLHTSGFLVEDNVGNEKHSHNEENDREGTEHLPVGFESETERSHGIVVITGGECHIVSNFIASFRRRANTLVVDTKAF
jgi:hypothetical protein